MKTLSILLIALLFSLMTLSSQENFSSDPLNAQFVTQDFDNFWKAFDQLDTSDTNPFEEYLDNASPGLLPFRDYLTADLFVQSIKERKAEYLKKRDVLKDLPSCKKRIQAVYAAMKYWNPNATFPPVYFAMGVFTSGGTASENGLLIGSELLENLNSLDGLIAHEFIHFQQVTEGPNTLLQQTIKEGSADFIGELVSGLLLSKEQKKYGEVHEDELCKEFIKTMYTQNMGDWLYTNDTKNGKPKDMGYWMGYQIVEAYFNKQEDKKQAIHNILNLKDSEAFLKESGYLDPYLKGKR
ncbi:MAG: DUF2268 domain-containing putative Zn-dependent protease [Bacteroidota bacterium]